LTDIKKHIVFITPGFAANEADDTTISALQIYCKKLQEREDINVSIVTLHFPFTKTHYNWYKSTVYPLGFNNKKLSVLSNRKVLKVLNAIHKQQPIDVLHSFWLGECAFIGHRFSNKHRINNLTTLMGQDAKKGNYYTRILPLKKMKFVTLSKFHQRLFLNNYSGSSTLIPWGVDEKSTSTMLEKSIDIIGIGSLISLKKYTDFIDTIYLLKKRNPTINATLIGEGKLKPQLLKQIHKLELSTTITLKGLLSYSETQQLLASAKILLHPSNYESFGMVFAEAMAKNVFIVSRKVGMAKNYSFWKTGDSVNEFFEGCQGFLEQDSPNISSYPTIDTTLKEYLKLYGF